MAKEWILNSATNRFQLNFKRNVGAVAEAIRDCSPRSLEDWQAYYYSNVRTEEHIEELGKKLYIKISEVLSAEIEDITEEDCIGYMKALVIDRTYDGYTTEIKTIYGQLANLLNMQIIPASDKWDRIYNVDFYIKVNGKYIGIQIKPTSETAHIMEIYKERELQLKTHEKFTQEYGGKVFYIFSTKKGNVKEIVNKDVVEEIKVEIARLQKL
jgi:MjaI restriction endonuclease.